MDVFVPIGYHRVIKSIPEQIPTLHITADYQPSPPRHSTADTNCITNLPSKPVVDGGLRSEIAIRPLHHHHRTDTNTVDQRRAPSSPVQWVLNPFSPEVIVPAHGPILDCHHPVLACQKDVFVPVQHALSFSFCDQNREPTVHLQNRLPQDRLAILKSLGCLVPFPACHYHDQNRYQRFI